MKLIHIIDINIATTIHIPPISERREDIIPICNLYLDYFNKNKKFNFILSKESINKLESYGWPGNVGQIINYIEKTIILNQGLNRKSDFILKELPINSSEKSICEPFNILNEDLSITIFSCFKSFSSILLSKVKSYFNPEHPPPFTAILKNVPIGFFAIK